jgi:hypothetical protein
VVRRIWAGQAAYAYDGFFSAIDTFKDKQKLDELYEGGHPPWEVWRDTNSEYPKVAELMRG